MSEPQNITDILHTVRFVIILPRSFSWALPSRCAASAHSERCTLFGVSTVFVDPEH